MVRKLKPDLCFRGLSFGIRQFGHKRLWVFSFSESLRKVRAD